MARLLLEIVTSAIAPPPGELLQLVPLLSRHFVFRRVLTQVSRPRPVLQVPSLAQPAKEAKRTFASFFRQKEDPSPRLTGEQKYRRSNAKAPAQLACSRLLPW